MAHHHTVTARLQSVAVLVIATAVLYFARDVFIPLAFALILTFLLTPVVDGLGRLHLGRVPAALAALIFSFLIVGIAVGVVGSELMDTVAKLPNYQQNIRQRIEKMRGISAIGGLTRGVETVTRELSNGSSSAPQQPANQSKNRSGPQRPTEPVPVEIVGRPVEGEWTTIRNLLAPLLAPIGTAGIVLVFTTFILIKKEDVRDRLIKLAGTSKISVTTSALEDAEDRVGHYLRFALLINSCFGGFIALGLSLIGLPNVALWGIIAALMRFVPYAGILISCAFPLLLSVAIFPEWLKPGLVILLFFVPEAIIGNVIEPLVYGANTGTSPLGLLVAAVFWTVLWGPLGLVLSTPLTVCVLVLGRYVPQLSFLHVLLAEEPALTEEARLYGRLLAADRDESQAIVQRMLQEKSLVELYDGLLIPALRLAEQDRHKGTLEAAQVEAVFHALNQVIVEIENQLDTQGRLAAGPELRQGEASLRFEPSPGCKQQIACMAVVDEADEICSTMLAQVLHHHNCPCIHFPSDWIHELREDADDIIFLSAVPPFAFVNARSYCARIRRQLPSSTIIVGMWGSSDDTAMMKERFGSAKPDYVVTRLADALELVIEARGG